MDVVANGLVAIANGALSALSAVMSPVSFAIVVAALCLGWLARLELDELNRHTNRTEVRRH